MKGNKLQHVENSPLQGCWLPQVHPAVGCPPAQPPACPPHLQQHNNQEEDTLGLSNRTDPVYDLCILLVYTAALGNLAHHGADNDKGAKCPRQCIQQPSITTCDITMSAFTGRHSW